MMKLEEQISLMVFNILLEIRTGFDFRKFKNMEYFEEKFDYANKHLKQLGSGSARTAFLLSNRFVLKIANQDNADNKTEESADKLPSLKGRAQNEAEVDLFTNPGMKPMVTKIYDNDSLYTWIVAELVRPLSDKEFERTVGVSAAAVERATELMRLNKYNIKDARQYAEKTFRYFEKRAAENPTGDQYYHKMARNFKESMTALGLPFTQSISELEKEFGVLSSDASEAKHWGKAPDGRVVLLDYGFTQTVADEHYSVDKLDF